MPLLTESTAKITKIVSIVGGGDERLNESKRDPLQH